MKQRMVKRLAVWAAAVVTAALAMVAVAAPAHAEPMCSGDTGALAFQGTYKLQMMSAGGDWIYASNLVLGAYGAATEFGTGRDPITGEAVPLTVRGQWWSQYLAGSTCSVAIYWSNGRTTVNCYGGSAPYTDGVRVVEFDGACRLRSAAGTILTRTFIADRI